MAIHWTIPFKSLRSGTVYTVNIYDSGHSGAAVALKGAGEPMSTDEDATDDEFAPIRTQSGYMRIVDDGKDAAGSAFNWKDILAATDNDRPVTITHQEGNATVTDWIGFMQSQTFSGVLYGNPQEREFPVVGALSILAGEDININRGLQNFAFLLKEACDTIASKSSGVISITGIYVQGGADARQWLLHKVDWQNFAEEDGNGVMRAKYSLFEVLEDMCRFWGWTARICGTTIYLTCADDSVEQDYLVLTPANLATLAAAETDTTTGSVVSPSTVTLADTSALHIFASTEQTDSKVQGPHRAVVKAECNEHDTVAQFAPKDIQDYMGDSYTWERREGYPNLVGYFTTPSMTATDEGSSTMKVTTGTYGRIARRQIYQSTDAESPVVGDMLMVLENAPSGDASIRLQTLRPMSFGGGSISFEGTLWRGAETLQQNENRYAIRAKLGIGMTRASAKWWYITGEISGQITKGWDTQERIFDIGLKGNNLNGAAANLGELWLDPMLYIYPAIPVEENLYGYIFIDILYGKDYTNLNNFGDFEIANFAIVFKRDTYYIPSSLGEVRPRELKTKRVTTKEYTATNSNASKEEWNANCIFASDNNMEYGYGLLLNASGNIVEKVPYGNTTDHPEQHLANRVASYWATAKRKIEGELQAHVVQAITGGTVKIGDILPCHKVSIDSNTFCPIAISRNWRDDVVKLSLLQI